MPSLIQAESGGRADAVSPKGARGVAQLMPATAAELHKKMGISQPLPEALKDPATNRRMGQEYLRQQLEEFQDPELALAAYNAGPGNVRKYGGVPPFPETQNYVRKVLGAQPSAAPTPTPTAQPAEELDQMYDFFTTGTTAPTVQPQTKTPQRSPEEMQRADLNARQQLQGALQSVAQGMTFGGADEASAALGGYIGSNTGASYEDRLAALRSNLKQFQEENPVLSTGLEITGAAAPGVLTGAAAGLGRAGTSLFGNTLRGALLGGTEGAAYGFGSGEENLANRYDLGAETGLYGALLGAAAPAVIRAGQKIAGSDLVRRLAEAFSDEAGAIGMLGPAKNRMRPSQAEQIVMRATRGSTADEINAAVKQLQEAQALGREVSLPELLRRDRGLRGAAMGVAESRGGGRVVEEAIESRKAGIIPRLSEDIGGLSTSKNISVGLQRGSKAAEKVVDDLIAARREAASPLYEALKTKTPIFDDPAVEKAIQLPRVQEAIQTVRKNVPELANLPDNHFEVLNFAKFFLDDQIGDAVTASSSKKTLQRVIVDQKNKLLQAMDDFNPDYKEARKAFAGPTEELTKIKEGPLSFLLDAKKLKPEAAVKKFMNLRGDQLDEALKTLGPEGTEGMREMALAYLQEQLETAASSGEGAVKKLIKSARSRKSLQRLLGDDAFNYLERITGLEQDLLDVAPYLIPNPNTGASLLMRNKGMEETAGAVASALRGDFSRAGEKALSGLFGATADEQLERAVAEIFMRPQEFLPQMSQLRTRVDPLVEALNQAIKTGGAPRAGFASQLSGE